MAPTPSAVATNDPSADDTTASFAWYIPFLIFYTFGLLVATIITFAFAVSNKWNPSPRWPPTCFRRDARFAPLYHVVLIVPALLWPDTLALAVLGGFWLLIRGGLLQKLPSESGRAGRQLGPLLSRERDRAGQVCLATLEQASANLAQDNVAQAAHAPENKEETDTSTRRNQEHAVRTQQPCAADESTRSQTGENEDHTQGSNRPKNL